MVISSPLTALSSLPYARPSRVHSTIASSIEQIISFQPEKSSCMQHTIAKRPPSMPMGSAKLGPVPDLMEGTIARTSRPFMPTRRRISENRMDMD